METAVEHYLQWALNDQRIIRRRLHGSNDLGDIANIFFHGQPVCVEVKNTKLLDATKHGLGHIQHHVRVGRQRQVLHPTNQD